MPTVVAVHRMSEDWGSAGPQEGPRVPTQARHASSAEALWRPKPFNTPDQEFQWHDVGVGCHGGFSSFATSMAAPCASTAPSESLWSSPALPLLDTPSGCSTPTTEPTVAAAGKIDGGVEVHQLSPILASECPEDGKDIPGCLMLPPAAPPMSSTNSEVSPLVQFLRRAKVLKMSLTQTMELQQQSLQLLLLHPRIALASLDTPCCWCSAAVDPQQQQQQSCVVMLQIEMLQELLKQSSSQLQQQQEDLHRGEVLLHEEQQRELQHHERVSTLLPQWQQQQNQTVAAAAAELRIRRSVLKHHYQQLEEALLQQQRLQQEARARWLVEAADEIRTCYPEASDVEVVKLLQLQGKGGLWGCELSDGLIGNQLREKREKLLRLEESLRQLQHMTGLLQEQQEKRQQQQQHFAAVIAHSEKLTAAACTDLLIAHKYRKQTIKHSLLVFAAAVLLFLFFVLPHTSLGSFLARISD